MPILRNREQSSHKNSQSHNSMKKGKLTAELSL